MISFILFRSPGPPLPPPPHEDTQLVKQAKGVVPPHLLISPPRTPSPGPPAPPPDPQVDIPFITKKLAEEGHKNVVKYERNLSKFFRLNWWVGKSGEGVSRAASSLAPLTTTPAKEDLSQRLISNT